MRMIHNILICACGVLLWSSIVFCSFFVESCTRERSPSEILRKHYNATGGIKRWSEIESLHTVQSIIAPDSQMIGSVEQWQTASGMYYRKVSFEGVSDLVRGFDGNIAWEMRDDDLRIDSSSNGRAIYRLDGAVANLKHLDPSSDLFRLTYSGVSLDDKTPCFIVGVMAVHSEFGLTYYIDTVNYICLRMDRHIEGQDMVLRYSDFVNRDGFTIAATQFVTDPKGPTAVTLSLDRWEVDSIPPSHIFDPPERVDR